MGDGLRKERVVRDRLGFSIPRENLGSIRKTGLAIPAAKPFFRDEAGKLESVTPTAEIHFLRRVRPNRV